MSCIKYSNFGLESTLTTVFTIIGQVKQHSHFVDMLDLPKHVHVDQETTLLKHSHGCPKPQKFNMRKFNARKLFYNEKNSTCGVSRVASECQWIF